MLRLESLQNVASSAFKEFLGIDNFQPVNRNIATEKVYAPLYAAFKKQIVFAQEYLDSLYDSDYMRTFYSADEINTAQQKWCIAMSAEVANRPTGCIAVLATTVFAVFLGGSIEDSFAHTPHDAIDALEMSPNYEEDLSLFIVVQNQLLHSTNRGATWKSLVAGLDSPYLLSDMRFPVTMRATICCLYRQMVMAYIDRVIGASLASF